MRELRNQIKELNKKYELQQKLLRDLRESIEQYVPVWNDSVA